MSILTEDGAVTKLKLVAMKKEKPRVLNRGFPKIGNNPNNLYDITNNDG